ncbi:hypothetical protein A2U01_0005257 [Trifolium medium]|uniref:Reverse transcriptase zinc-binding domain-containing protein n=1 Tax=Trifolium medium TaxID=97028 RepID=A0A392MBE6_9FABA|nr:hypothetical protein [Trifolium medium]
MLGECQTLLLHLSLQVQSSDRRQWQLDSDKGYTVRGAYQLLMLRQNILSSAAHHCVSSCGAVESAQHLFLSCSTFGSLWSLVCSWIGSSSVTAQTLSDHFVQFTNSAIADTREPKEFEEDRNCRLSS